MKYYLIFVYGGTDPYLYGPFANEDQRLSIACDIWKEYNKSPEHILLKLNVKDGIPSIFPFIELDDYTSETVR
jgi:hypothetical protein